MGGPTSPSIRLVWKLDVQTPTWHISQPAFDEPRDARRHPCSLQGPSMRGRSKSESYPIHYSELGSLSYPRELSGEGEGID